MNDEIIWNNFHHDIHHDEQYDDDWKFNHDNYSIENFDIQNVNFVIESSASHLCIKCLINFKFRNKLFKHFKQCRFKLIAVHNVSMINKPQFKKSRLMIFKINLNNSNEKPKYVFRSWQYIVIQTQLKDSIKLNICVNFDNSIFMIDRSFLRNILLNHLIQRMIIIISIQKINKNVIKSDEFIIIKITFEEVNNKEHSIKNVITAKLHVINDFNVNLLIKNDVLISKNMIVDLSRRKLVINNCENLKISIKVKTRKNFHIKRIIRAKQAYIIMFNEIIEISVIWRDRNLSNNRDLLFKSNCFHYLNHENDSYVSIVDVILNKILIKNIIETSVTLIKRVQLNIIIKYNQIECYLIMLDEDHKAIEN